MIVTGSGATRTVRGTTVPTLISKSTRSTRGALEVSTFSRIVVFCSVVSETFLEVIGRSAAPCLDVPVCGDCDCCWFICSRDRSVCDCWLFCCSLERSPCDCCLPRSPRGSVCDCSRRSPRGCSPCDCWVLLGAGACCDDFCFCGPVVSCAPFCVSGAPLCMSCAPFCAPLCALGGVVSLIVDCPSPVGFTVDEEPAGAAPPGLAAGALVAAPPAAPPAPLGLPVCAKVMFEAAASASAATEIIKVRLMFPLLGLVIPFPS